MVEILITGGLEPFIGEDYTIYVSENGRVLQLYYASSEQGIKEAINRAIREHDLEHKEIKVDRWTRNNLRLQHW